MKKLICIVLAMTLVLALASCGQEAQEAPAETVPEQGETANEPAPVQAEDAAQAAEDAAQAAEDAAQAAEDAAQAAEDAAQEAEEDGQNPVMNFVGIYGAGRATILVEAEGEKDAKISVTWGSSACEYSEWSMSGELDEQTLSVNYNNCVRTDIIFNGDGDISSETVAYENGTGRIVFSSEDYSLTWEDDQDHIADETVFLGSAPDVLPQEAEGDPDYYTAVTALSKTDVENTAADVRQAYLDQDWESIVGLVRFPITIDGTEITDADSFLTFMGGATVAQEDLTSMEEETCHDMFVNGQGICMASGQIWLNDPNYMTDEAPILQIIAINGVVSK